MLQSVRYEQYVGAQSELPFLLQTSIERTALKRSREPNFHEELEIELCTEGCGSVLLNGESLDFGIGDIIVVNSDVVHYTGTSDRLVYTCLIVKLDFCATVGIEPRDLFFSQKIQSPALRALIDELCALYADDSLSFRRARMCETVLRILIELAQNHSEERREFGGERPLQIIRETLCYIRESYAQKITLDELSKRVYTDKYALCRLFMSTTGYTIVDYITSYRPQKAAELISSGSTVAEAARACGFDNLSFFTKTFKKYMGSLPSDFKA